MLVTVAAEANPTVARRKLAVYFRKQREQHGYSLGVLTDVLGVNSSQASRLDTGARGFQAEHVVKLARLYNLPDTELTRLLALADESHRRAWWQKYDLEPAYRTMIGMEQAARSISEFAGVVMPGLLQTPDYARAVADLAPPDVGTQRIDDAVDVRSRRREVLTRQAHPQLWVVIDEAVLARVGGSRAVMRGQLEHLAAKSDEPDITVQVVGFDYGLYSTDSHFIILDMPDGLPDVLYQESLQRATDTTDPVEVAMARKRWDLLRAVALSPRESAERILQYLDRLRA